MQMVAVFPEGRGNAGNDRLLASHRPPANAARLVTVAAAGAPGLAGGRKCGAKGQW